MKTLSNAVRRYMTLLVWSAVKTTNTNRLATYYSLLCVFRHVKHFDRVVEHWVVIIDIFHQ